jgi:hypothetical protein
MFMTSIKVYSHFFSHNNIKDFSGWCRIVSVTGPAGTTVTLRHAEVLLSNGMIYTANLRTAKATDTYTLRVIKKIVLL